MNSQVVECQVMVATMSGKEEPGQVKIQTWDKKDRMARAAKFWGGAWVFMVLSVLLPIAHFFLVPAFFLAGPIVAFVIFKQESRVMGGQSRCPQCHETLPLVAGPNKWPLEDLCTKCQTHVTIKKI